MFYSSVKNFRRFMETTPPNMLPSPNNPVGAYDSALSDESSSDLREFLESKLSSEDYRTACQYLDNADGEDDEDIEIAGEDEPPAFSGRHRPGGLTDPLAAKNRLRQASDAASTRSQARYKRMFPGAALIRTNVFGQDASLEDFHNFLDSLDAKADPNKDPGLDGDPDDLLDPRQFMRGSAGPRKEEFVDDEGEEISEQLRRHLKAKLAPDHFREMTKRFDKRPAMDAARSRYHEMFPGASKIRNLG